MVSDKIRVATITYGYEEACDVVAGYAFGQRVASTWKAPAGEPYGEEPASTAPYRWAYSSYDSGHRPEEQLGLSDLWAPAGLDGRLTADRVLRMLTVLDAINDALARISEGTTFWGLPRSEIQSPAEGQDGWWLARAWWLLRGAAGSRAWVTPYKVLHRARPHLFPLIDNQTRPLLQEQGSSMWLVIHDDLTGQAAAFDRLEEWFSDLADSQSPDAVTLTRLRLHDILLWCHAKGQREIAAQAGRAVRG